ncbi:Divalent metal cation transporter MntH [archaeon HR06]|nr:Divalent metal cation transporter MntH [archaeon HR06]
MQRRSALSSFFNYLGPSLIVSMAYMDPGNYGTDIQAGASFNYDLIWAVFLASAIAMLFQYLSGKIGIATGKSIPELVRESLNSKVLILAYWFFAEIAVIATDLAEYTGTVLALNILFNIPLLYAAFIAAFDVLLLLTIGRFRVLEYFFMLFVSVISIGFLYEVIVIRPDFNQIVTHAISPYINSENVLTIVGIIGATVMPHALFVHSSLTKNRLNEYTVEEKRLLRKLHLFENISTLSIAGLVNTAILVTAAAAFYPNFKDISTIDEAYRIMAPLYGQFAAVIFGVTLLFSGIASSTTGTLAGQAIMDGLLGVKVNKYIRRLVTRVINVFPIAVAITLGLNPLSILVYSQVILSLMIPLPMIPLIFYSSKGRLMGEFVNRRYITIISIIASLIVLIFNGFFLFTIFASRFGYTLH